MHEINSMNGLKSTIDDSKSNHLTNKIPPLKQEEEANNVLKWTEKDVEKWFRDKNVKTNNAHGKRHKS